MDNWHEFEKIYSDITTKASPELTASLLQTGMATYDTNIKQMTASLQILGITIGNELLPMLKSMALGLTEGVEWLNKHREETKKVIEFIGLFAKALVLYKVQQILATTSLLNFIGTSKMMAANAPTFVGAIASMGRSMAGLAVTIGSALFKMAAFMAMAELISRVSAGWSQDSAEKDFKTKVAGAGSTDGGAGHRLTEEEQQILKDINERDEFRRTHSVGGTADGGITGAVMYKNGDDLYKANALDRKVMEGLQAIEAKKGLDKVNAMVELASKGIPEGHSKPEYDTVQGQDLGSDSGSSAGIPKDTTASIEDKLELHTEKRKLAEVLHNAKKAKDAYDTRIDDIKSYEEINGADTFSMLEYMDARKLMIKTMQTQNETLGYDIEGLEILINAHIATNEELQGKLAGKDAKGNLIGYADMSKEQRRHQLAINSDLLSNDKNLSGYMSIKDSAENKVSENNKEISKLSNDNLVQNSQLKPEDIYRTKLERNKVSEEIALANATNKLDMNNEIALNKIKLDTMLANKKLYVDELRRLDDIVAEDMIALNAKENEGNKAAIEKQLQLHQDAADKQRAIVARNANDIIDLEYAKNAKINEGMAGITSDILVQGNSLRQVWDKLWNDLANDAIKALFRVNNSTPSLLGSILGLFGGGATATGGTSWGNTFGTSVSGGMFTFADGGISDKPAIFGEAGAEMAIPLTQGKRGRALELYAKTGALLGVNKGTDVVANVSPRTMEIAQQSSATAQMARINAEHLSRLDTQIGLMTQQNSMILTMLGQGGGQGGVVQPIVMSQSMDKGQLWSMIESMRRDGYKV